eukprot:1944928-Prymnesium_polylepis.1
MRVLHRSSTGGMKEGQACGRVRCCGLGAAALQLQATFWLAMRWTRVVASRRSRWWTKEMLGELARSGRRQACVSMV